MTHLYRVREVSDLFVDACIRHPASGELLFLSIYGRDGPMLELFASFSLPKSQGGMTEFTLLDADGIASTVPVNQPDRLQKLTGKLPKGNLFGNLGHAWLYDRDLAKPDRANRCAWGLYSPRLVNRKPDDPWFVEQRLWQQLRDLSPVPLAEHWCEPVLAIAHEQGFVRWLDGPDSLYRPLGDMRACRIELGNRFIDAISEAVRCGLLQLETPDKPPAGLIQSIQTVTNTFRQKTSQQILPLTLGQIVVTHAVDAEVPKDRVMDCLRRHRAGDWGQVQADSQKLNDAALRSGEDRIMSAYAIDPTQPCSGHGDNTLWVITEWDRSVTTVLYPSDY